MVEQGTGRRGKRMTTTGMDNRGQDQTTGGKPYGRRIADSIQSGVCNRSWTSLGDVLSHVRVSFAAWTASHVRTLRQARVCARERAWTIVGLAESDAKSAGGSLPICQTTVQTNKQTIRVTDPPSHHSLDRPYWDDSHKTHEHKSAQD